MKLMYSRPFILANVTKHIACQIWCDDIKLSIMYVKETIKLPVIQKIVNDIERCLLHSRNSISFATCIII